MFNTQLKYPFICLNASMSVPWSIKLPCTLTYSAKAEAFALEILESHLSGHFPLLLLHSL